MCTKHYQRLRKHGTTDDFPPCSAQGCTKPSYSRGMCQTHYTEATFADRFWARVEKTDSCWLWKGPVLHNGYGRASFNYKPRLAHRVAYELLVGPIPDGQHLDHVRANGCSNRRCVKAIADEYGPAHLEPTTSQQNILRGVGLSAENARKTHCKHGHPFDEDNTYLWRGHRHCRTCQIEGQRRRRATARTSG